MANERIVWNNGAADRDLGTAGSWVGGVAPSGATPDDYVYFTGEFTSANTGPNAGNADLTAVDVYLVQVTNEYTENICTSGLPMTICANKVEHYGQGTLYYADGSAAGGTDHFLCDVSRTIATSGTAFELSGATTALLSLLRGRGIIKASAAVTTIHLGQYGRATPDAHLTIDAGAGTITTVRAFGGMGICDSTFTTLESMAGSTWTQRTATITNIYVFPGARINLTFTGTYTSVFHYGGIIDCRTGGPKTFTNYYKGFQNEDEQNVILGNYLVNKTNLL
jgi:hypothetical protein